MNTINIVNISKDDIAPVAELESICFGEHGYPPFFIRQAYDCWAASFYVAKIDNRVVGYLLQSPKTNTKDAWILSLAVSPTSRGLGIGKALLKHCIAHSTMYHTLFLTVCPKNTAAVNLYAQLNFTLHDEESNYFDINDSRQVLQLALPTPAPQSK
ncbi:GNAT family N-acetyltransferase [Vibrio sp. Of7-15]|uniref:GNAT family N-acetyltransferase n=1 Tax=Vibrio sp. Of7-15 TaxID=2724879 RepID=UPI001EF22F65|nr:GNAT family N-acetyltransferase [Vibrio sp. Of7-15]MCG7497857.1 GNAT family N-acetyltransferase [Vibrio sp. Of7-15]